jgi:hypothetical protein
MATNEELIKAITSLTDVVDDLNKSLGGDKDKTTSSRQSSASDSRQRKSAIETAATEGAMENLRTQQDLLKILERQLEVEDLKNLRQSQHAKMATRQNAITDSVMQRSNALKASDLELQKALVEQNIKNMTEEERGTEEGKKKLKLLGDQLEAIDAQHARYTQTNVALGSLNDSVDNLLGLVMLSSKAYEKSFFGQLEQASGGINLNFFKGLAAGFAEVGQMALKAVHPLGLFSTAINMIKDNTIEMVKAQNQALASFAKSTGLLGDYQQRILTTRQENTEFYVTLDTSHKANEALVKSFRQFTEISEDSKDALAAFTTQMDAIGVSTEMSTELMNESYSALHMSLADTKEMMGELYVASQRLGTGQNELMQEFKASLPTLAVYGDRAKDVYLGLAGAAKAAGMATDDLLGIVGSQFDTFPGAAEAVSGLNAILGGQYLNSLELVNTSEEHRARAIVASMEASGRQFAQMSKHEQRAIAAKLGIQDLAKANKLLSLSTAELDAQMAGTQGLGGLSEEEMQRLAEVTTSFGEKFTALTQSFTLAIEPFIDLIGFLLESFATLVNSFQDNKILKLAGAFGIAALGAKLFSLGLGATTAMLGGKAAATTAHTAALALNTQTMRANLVAQGFDVAALQARATAQLAAAGTAISETAATVGSTAATAGHAAVSKGSAVATGIATAAKALFVKETQAEVAATLMSIPGKLTDAAITAAWTVTQGFANLMQLENNSLTWLGIAAKYAALIPMGLLTAASWALAGATWAATSPIGLLVAALLGLAAVILVPMFSPPLYIGIGILVGGIIALAVASKASAGPIGLAAIAMAALGKATSGTALAMAGLALSALGVAFAVGAVAISVLGAALGLGLISIALGVIAVFGGFAAGALFLFGLSLVALNIALLAFAATSWLTLPVMWGIAGAMFTAGLGAIMLAHGFAEQGVSLDALRTRLVAMDKAVKEFSVFGLLELNILTSIVDQFERLVDAIGRLNTINMLAIGMTMREVGQIGGDGVATIAEMKGLVTATAAVSPDSAENVARMMREASRLMEASAVTEPSALEGLRDIISELIQGQQTTAATKDGTVSAQPREIKLYMDRDGRKVFAKGIVDELSPELSKRLSINKGPQI